MGKVWCTMKQGSMHIPVLDYGSQGNQTRAAQENQQWTKDTDRSVNEHLQQEQE